MGFVPFVWAEEPEETVRKYFHAIQEGNVHSVKEFLGESLYKKKKELLNDNSEYGEFLKKYYDGAEFVIESSSSGGEPGGQSSRKVKVTVEFPGGNTSAITLITERDSSGSWKIIDEQ